MIQIFAAEGPGESLNKWVRPRNLGYRLHSFHVQDPQIGLPTVKLEQRIVIGTKLLGQTVARDGLVEHAADADAVDVRRFNTESDDPVREDIHDEHHPEALQQDGLASEQVDAP